MHAKTLVRVIVPSDGGPVHPGALVLEMPRERAPRGRIEAQHRAVFPVLRVAHRDHGGRPAHLYAVALAARIGGYTPASDHLIIHSSLLISVMSCAESIGDSAHPLITLSAVAMAATSLGSLTTLPEPHPSR